MFVVVVHDLQRHFHSEAIFVLAWKSRLGAADAASLNFPLSHPSTQLTAAPGTVSFTAETAAEFFSSFVKFGCNQGLSLEDLTTDDGV